MTSLTWLHLSDFHFSEERKPERQAVEDALLKDIEVLVKEGGLRPNLIFLTGDIAFSGKKKEYSAACSFLDQVLRATGVSKERLFVVPGNHDVNRSRIGAARHFGSALSEREAVSELLTDTHARDLFLRRQIEYREFIEAYFGPNHPMLIDDLFYIQRIIIGGLDVAVIGLNSAWASGNDREYGQLVLGEWQVRQSLEKASGADLIICLVHHPFEWLREFDRDDVVGLIERSCDVVVRGHLHKTRLEICQTPIGYLCILAAGSSFGGRQHPNAYNMVAVDSESATACAYPRLWVDESGGYWTWDNRSGPLIGADGRYQFALPCLRERQLSHPVSSSFTTRLGECLKVLDADLLKRWQSDLPVVPHEYVPTSLVALSGETCLTTELTQQRRAVVLGPPGSGKSSAAIHASRILANLAIQRRQLQLPLYVDLAGLASGTSVLEMIEEHAMVIYQLDDRLEVKRHLQAGHFILLIDSADELPPREFGLRMAEILSLSRSPSGADSAFILFCSDFIEQSFFRNWTEFPIFDLAPMSQQEMEVLSCSLGDVPLPDDKDVLAFCCFPFYLCLYAQVRGKILQGQRGTLLEQFIVESVRRRAESWLRPDEVPVFLTTLLATLSKIAEKSPYASSLSAASVAETVAAATTYQEQVQQALINSGILEFSQGEYRFRSRIVNDYFLARALVSQPERWQFCLKDSRLQDIAFILADLLPARQRVHLARVALDVVAGGSISTFLNYNLTSLETTPERLIRAIGGVSSQDVVRSLRDSELPPVAGFRLVNILASIGGRAAIKCIRDILQDRSRHVYLRVGAVLAASRLEPDACVPIMQAIQNDDAESPLLRLESRRTLARLKKHLKLGVVSPGAFQHYVPRRPLSKIAIPRSISQLDTLIQERISRLRGGATPENIWLAERMKRVFYEREGVPTTLAVSLLNEQWQKNRSDIIDLIWWLIETIGCSPFSFYLDRTALELEKPNISTSIYFEPILDVPVALSQLNPTEAQVILKGYQIAASAVTEDYDSLVAKLAYLDLLRQWTLPLDLLRALSSARSPVGQDISVEVARRRVSLMHMWLQLVADRWLDDNPELLHLCHDLGFATEGTVFQQVVFQPNSAGHCLFARIHYALDAVRNPEGYEWARSVTVKLAQALVADTSRTKIAADSLYDGVIGESPAILRRLHGQSKLSYTLIEGVHTELMDLHVRLQEKLLGDWEV